jgi:hypothetical protein
MLLGPLRDNLRKTKIRISTESGESSDLIVACEAHKGAH